MLHNIDPIRQFAAIRVNQYKLVVNQDAVFNTTWHPRYEVSGKLGRSNQPHTLPGAIIECGLENTSQKVDCNTNLFPCLFDISKGMLSFNHLLIF